MKKLIYTIISILVIIIFCITFFLYKVGDKVVDELFNNTMELDQAYSNHGTDPRIPYNKNKNEESSNIKTSSEKKSIDSTEHENTKIEEFSSKSSSLDSYDHSKAMTVPSKEKLQEIKNNITAADKIFIASSVLQKFTSEEISQMQNMAQNGLDTKEKAVIKKIVSARLTKDDITRLKQMYYKYK